MSSKERRSCVRGDISFKVKFRVATPEEYEKVRGTDDQLLSPDKETGIDIGGTDKRAPEITPNSYMIDFLLYIDEKLDQILAVLSTDQVGKGLYRQGVGVSISGAGMNIIADKSVEHGQIIHTNFVLSRFPLVFIDVLGEVVQVTPVDKDGKTTYSFGIKFLNLKSSDRESIIACVFQRQREIIRKMKGDR
ncbi:MAG: PilZ domain-containing protein [Deltaproteobacteria bacterium]|nr:MAG: PilZ domain-containing protein [Deltaproteobacteria bacterium]